MVYKFAAPPVKDTNGVYDERLDVALLRPAGESVEDYDTWVAEQAAHKEDPTKPTPQRRAHYEFFLPPDKTKVRGIKRNFTTNDPDNEDEIPFDHGVDEEGRPRKFFKYENIRTYETAAQTGDASNTYGDILVLALHDPESHPDEALRSTQLQKAAYFYPISQRVNIRPKRLGKTAMVGGDVQKVDIIETAARDPTAHEAEKRETLRQQYDTVEI
jgi:RNA polymerase II-associated factor 1